MSSVEGQLDGSSGPGLATGPRLGSRIASQPTLYAAAAVFAAAAGALVVRSPAAAVAAVAAVAVGAVASRLSRLWVAQLLLAALPWLVIFDGLTPHLLRTFVTAAAAVALLAVALPLRYSRALGPVAAVAFIGVVVANGVFATASEQYIQVAKYLIFPAVSLAVLSERGQEQLPRARNFILMSCLAAMVVHLGIVTVGLGQAGTKYDIGEKLGFGRDIVHEMGLTFVIIAAAGLISTKRIPVQVAFFALGAVPALLTGVRSALLALLVVVVLYLIRTRFNRRALAVIALMLVVAMASGGAKVVENRFNASSPDQTALASGGFGLSQRGEIWTVALDAWSAGGPPHWFFGLGPGSVEYAEIHELGKPLFGHSDLIEIGVQLGLVGFAIWSLLWFALLRSPLENIVLAPIIVYAFVNGSAEYVAPLTLGLAFAAACRPPPEPAC